MTEITKNSATPAAMPQMRADARRNREAVLEAARAVFADKGMDGQMDEIAQLAKVGVGTVYRHFPNKEDLLDALIVQRFEALKARATEAVEEARTGDPWDAFEGFVRFSAGRQTEDRALAEAMANRSERMHAAAIASGLVPELAKLLQIGKRAGAIRKDLIVDDIPSVVCGCGSVAIAGMEKPGWRWDRVLGIWLDGVRATTTQKLPPVDPADRM